MSNSVNKTCLIGQLISEINELQKSTPDIDLSGSWNLSSKNGIPKFSYDRRLPENLQIKLIAIFTFQLGDYGGYISAF